MNKEEFLEMQVEFGKIIYNYEKFLKDNILIDYRYNAAFFPMLSKTHHLEVENAMLLKCLHEKANGTDFDVDAFIADVKKNFKEELPKLLQKNQIARIVVSHQQDFTPEEYMKFEMEYSHFIEQCHPIVTCIADDEEQKAYHTLKQFYYENNLNGFRTMYEKLKPAFKHTEVPEEHYNKISEYYYDMRKNISQDFTKKQSIYPFTKREVFVDEMSIAREEGELKSDYTRLVRDNKKLHEDFIKMFTKDVFLLDDPE